MGHVSWVQAPWLWWPCAHCPIPAVRPVLNGMMNLHSLWLCPALESRSFWWHSAEEGWAAILKQGSAWEHLQLGCFGQMKQKCPGLESPLLKCNSMKEFVGWNGKGKKINNVWIPREHQGILSEGGRKRSSSAFTLILQLPRFAHRTWMLQRRQKSLAWQAVIYINLFSQGLTLKKYCHIYFSSMFTVETALSVPR